MATIKEISEKANVSIATVSKVLNGKGRVTDQTRQHILDIASELNYRPNLYARNLKAKSTKTIGIITEDLTVFNAPEIVDGIAATCEENGYHYILGNLRLFKLYGNGPKDPVRTKAITQEVVDHMISNQVDGIIYIGYHSHLIVSPTDHHGTRFVYAYCTSEDKSVPSILYNEEKAAYEATELLLEHNPVKLGMVTGLPDSPHSISRIRGFQKAMFDHAIPYDPTLTIAGDWDRDSGYEAAEILIPQGVNAIFAHNDVMASGIIDYCNNNGIQVGKDVFLIGFDNREIASVCRPTLTTVALPLFEIGQAAATQLIDMLAGKEVSESNLLLDCTIIRRESA